METTNLLSRLRDLLKSLQDFEQHGDVWEFEVRWHTEDGKETGAKPPTLINALVFMLKINRYLLSASSNENKAVSFIVRRKQ